MTSHVEFGERIAGDIAHCIPVATNIYGMGKQRLSKSAIEAIIQTGLFHLCKASKVLLDEDNKAALIEISAYNDYNVRCSRMCAELIGIEKDLESVGTFQLLLKVQLYNRSVAQVQAVIKFRCEVATKSTQARLEIQRLTSSSSRGHTSTSSIPFSSGSQLTVICPTPSTSWHSLPSNEDLQESEGSHDDDQHSDTDSIFGNPWKDHERPNAPCTVYVEVIYDSEASSKTPQ